MLTGVVMSVVTMEFAWLKASCWKKFPSVTSYQPLTKYRQTSLYQRSEFLVEDLFLKMFGFKVCSDED